MVGNGQAKGSLHNLQRLEILANKLCEEEGQKIKEIDEINQLKERLRELKETHRRLNEQLKFGPKQVLHRVIKKKANRKVKGQKILEALKLAKLRKQQELLKGYRLTGISVTAVTDNRIRVCFDTCYCAEYHESFYMELNIRNHGVFSVYRHTLPYFIPLQSLIDDKLNENTKDFLITISRYLIAYVGRREQTFKTQEKFGNRFSEKPLYSNAFDFMELNLYTDDTEDNTVKIKLLYDDLLEHLPTRVSVVLPDDCPAKISRRLKKLKNLLQTKPLPDVLGDM